MNKKVKIAGLAAAIGLPAAAITGGIAQAQTHRAPAGQFGTTATEQSGGTDTDNVQEGDQTGSDDSMKQAVTRATRAAIARSAPALGHSFKGTKGSKGAHAAAGKPGPTTQSGGSAGTADEGSGEGEGEGENGGNDGSGGHQDPGGDVNHQFDGEE